jgi:Cu/Ag efflux protein CusF
MRRIRRLFSALAIAGASWFIATPSFADPPSPADQPPPADQPSPADQPPSGDQPSSQEPTTTITQKTQKISATARVVTVDAEKRDLTLRSDDGTEFTVEVPRSVKVDRIREGDQVKIDYYEAIGLSLKKPQPGAQPRADETTTTVHNAGTLPSGMVAHRITATVEVVRLDRARNRLTVRRPSGAIDTINVTDPALQTQLANVHEGDRIQATYTEAAAIRVIPEGATNQRKQ